MPRLSNLATAEPPPRRLLRDASCPLVGALGGAAMGLMTGDPLGACIGHGGLMGQPNTDDTIEGDEL